MNKIIASGIILLSASLAKAQFKPQLSVPMPSQGTGTHKVLIEEFTETGCGACAQYDTTFQKITDNNADKAIVINYHCFYSEDPFYNYNKLGYQRYKFYNIKDGFPSVMVNGKMPSPSSAHMNYVTAPLISRLYNTPPSLDINISTSKAKTGAHAIDINVQTTALKDLNTDSLRLFAVVTENNIDYKARYHSEAINGINKYNHMFRAMLTDTIGMRMTPQVKGNVSSFRLSYANDDKEINYKEVRIVAFIQDLRTREVIAVAETPSNPFK